MIVRVSRLVQAELIKLFAHPFLYVALAVLAAATILAEILVPFFTGQQETVWRSQHALQLFAYGFGIGLRIATFVLLIFSSMMFAGEFDRGTIKNLLTRPITRTDFFLAKCVATVILAVLLYFFLLYVGLAYAMARGELGPVWDSGMYLMQRSALEMGLHARKTIVICFLPFLAAGFLGILVSNWTESSGHAIAITLVLFLFGDLVTGMLHRSGQMHVFLYYPSYALEKLREYAEGGSTAWNATVDRKLLYVTVPLAYIGVFVPAAYGFFRMRNIRA